MGDVRKRPVNTGRSKLAGEPHRTTAIRAVVGSIAPRARSAAHVEATRWADVVPGRVLRRSLRWRPAAVTHDVRSARRAVLRSARRLDALERARAAQMAAVLRCAPAVRQSRCPQRRRRETLAPRTRGSFRPGHLPIRVRPRARRRSAERAALPRRAATTHCRSAALLFCRLFRQRRLDHVCGVSKGFAKVRDLEIRIVREDLRFRHAVCEHREDGGDWDPQTTNTGHAPHLPGALGHTRVNARRVCGGLHAHKKRRAGTLCRQTRVGSACREVSHLWYRSSYGCYVANALTCVIHPLSCGAPQLGSGTRHSIRGCAAAPLKLALPRRAPPRPRLVLQLGRVSISS